MQTSAFGTSAAASACHSLRKPRIAGGAPSARGEVGQRRDPDPAADEQRPLDVEVEAVAERAEHVQLVAAARARRARACPGPIGSIRNASSPAAARQTLIGRGSTRPGASSMKNWPGTPRRARRCSTRSSVYGPTCSVPVTLRSSRLMLDPLLEGARDLLARVRDRVDGEPGAGERRDAGHAARRAPPAGSARRRAGRRSPAAC